MPRSLLVAVALLTLVLGACSEEEKPRTLEHLPQIERTVPANADRDPAEVEAALTSVDPCLLFTRRAAHRVGDDFASRTSADPHACRIGENLTTLIMLGSSSTGVLRYHQGRHEAAGAVSYRTTTSKRDCSVFLPVNHDTAIEVRSFDRPCADTVVYAEEAARLLLKKPRSVQRAADDKGRFSACALLDAALPRAADRTEIAFSLSDCSKSADTTAGDAGARLILDSSTSITDEPRARDINGITATIDKVEGECWVQWDLTGVEVTDSRFVARARLMTASCADARALLPKVDAATRRTPPPGSPVGLLFPWEDGVVNDIAGVGACADIADEEALECAPAERVEVPEDPFDFVEQAAADPNVACAAVTPIVQQHLGNEMKPATSLAHPREGREGQEIGTQCAFGEPTHAVHVTVRMSTGLVASTSSGQEVAGHLTVITEPSSVKGATLQKSFQIALDDSGIGGLTLTVWVTPDRDLGNWQGIDVDEAPLEASDALAADLAESLL